MNTKEVLKTLIAKGEDEIKKALFELDPSDRKELEIIFSKTGRFNLIEESFYPALLKEAIQIPVNFSLGDSVTVQKKLFELGCGWYNGKRPLDKNVFDDKAPLAINVNKKGMISIDFKELSPCAKVVSVEEFFSINSLNDLFEIKHPKMK